MSCRSSPGDVGQVDPHQGAGGLGAGSASTAATTASPRTLGLPSSATSAARCVPPGLPRARDGQGHVGGGRQRVDRARGAAARRGFGSRR